MCISRHGGKTLSEVFDWKTELKDFSQLKVRDKVDWGELVRLQVNRCLMALSDTEHPEMFEQHAIGLLNLIPEDVRDVDFNKKVDGCIEEKNVKVPKEFCGVIQQPIEEKKMRVTDFRKLFAACISKIQLLGMGMKVREEAVIP